MRGQHIAYARVTVRSPSGRSLTQEFSDSNRVTTYTYFPFYPEDGTFTIENVAREYCPVVHMYFSDGTQTTTKPIDPYVYLSTVTWSKATVNRQSVGADLIVSVTKSIGCTATSVQLQANFYTTTTGLKFGPAFNEGPVAFVLQTAQKAFTVITDSGNTTAGIIQGDGLITTNGGCNLQGVAAKTATPYLTVN